MSMAPGPAPLRFPSQRECPFDPPAVQTALRESCPVAPVELHDGQAAWLISRYDDIRMVLSDERFSSSGLWKFAGSANRSAAERAETSFTVLDPPDHTHLRRLFTRYFTLRRVESMRGYIQGVVDEAIDSLMSRADRRADLVTDFALPVASRTMCALVGVPYEDHEWFEARADVRSRMEGDPQEAARATQELLAYMANLIEIKRAEPGPDIISSTIVDLLDPGLISQTDLVAALRLLLTAGHETTATMIATSAFVLLTHDDQLGEIRSDQSLLTGAIEELLRYISMLFILVRTAKQDLLIQGQQIKAGEGLIVGPALANKDPRAFDMPNRFDIHRDSRHHVAFGFGPHQCLGQPVARLELSIALGSLIRRLPSLKLAEAASDIPFKNTNLVGVAALPVAW
ncbi:cytochrome P450 [Arthrobacter sp. KBS0702]|uniref:cytochrome P450 n=1 Tax=Arthrobacter sp. KBS0702 TaxID=2578107 RepID=UPI001643A4CF|nr:cytochrome P450 [Arthrobacter sp. KBS0702]